jgi:nucleotide-binding universal stress UspA family protein
MTPGISRILVPLDFSTSSRRALDYANGLARKFGAALHLVHVCEVPSMMTGSMDAYATVYSDWTQRLGDDAKAMLLEITASLGDVPVTTEVLFGSPAGAIVDAAVTNRSNLIVMGTHGHGAVMHVLMGNVAERVVRTAPCAVLTVREPKPKEPAVGAKPSTVTLVAAILAAGAMVAGRI